MTATDEIMLRSSVCGIWLSARARVHLNFSLKLSCSVNAAFVTQIPVHCCCAKRVKHEVILSVGLVRRLAAHVGRGGRSVGLAPQVSRGHMTAQADIYFPLQALRCLHANRAASPEPAATVNWRKIFSHKTMREWNKSDN